MIYERIAPSGLLTPYIESFWLIDSQGNAEIDTQKIIPDGFPEVIFHYGDPYEININGTWERQDVNLLAGQIRNHFFLRNTGASGMLGVKFMPSAIAEVFGLDMSDFTDQVVPLRDRLPSLLELRADIELSLENKGKFIECLEKTLTEIVESDSQAKGDIETAVSHILENKGLVTVKELCEVAGKSERQLERLFSRYVGLSPKFYSRIIRLGHIFELMRSQDQSWSDLVYQSGFYDQSHFIKNFKEFTGEDPSSYGFDEKNMANFHMNK